MKLSKKKMDVKISVDGNLHSSIDSPVDREKKRQYADKNYTVLVQQSVLASPSFRLSDLATTSERML